MILAYLLLFTGLTISSVAIYYSVVGLTAIFSAAAVPIMIMGVSLEVAKLVCATWIKQNWAQVPRLMKIYMCIAVTVLMLITSMGIFGFLSKAHNDQNLVSGDVGAKLAIFDEKIKTARDNIEADRKQLKQMDEAVDQVMARSTSESGADKSNAIRKSQARDRAALAKDIETNQKIISQLNDEAAPIRAENRKVEAEVGPIKYIAAFIYGTAPDASMLEKAVTWIIIMIVIVFDPLAVIMLLASQMTFAWQREQDTKQEEPKEESKLEGWHQEWVPDTEAWPEWNESEYQENKLDDLSELNGLVQKHQNPDVINTVELTVPEEPPKKKTRKPRSKPVKEIVPEELVESTTDIMDRPGDYLPASETNIERPREAAPGRNRGVMHSHLVAEPDNTPVLGKASHSNFGNEFPNNPEKGDVYLRVDYLPNRLYKFNGTKWIEVDKNQTDVYAYDESYIKHLIDEIDAGRYDTELLTDVEREQIKNYLNNAQ